MSGHVRFAFAALLVAGFSTPAAANVITDLFSPAPAPDAATAAPAAAAPDDCLRQPGPSAAGTHWVYRYDGHRKCWFQAAAGSAAAKRAVRRHAAKHSEENEPLPRGPKAFEDARDEVMKPAPAQPAEAAPPAPAETQQPAPSEPKLTIVHTVPVHLADAAAQVPPAPTPATSGADQPAAGQPASGPSMPRHVDVEKLLADAPAASDEVASAPPAIPAAAFSANRAGGEQRTTSWLGMLLIALGGAALLIASLRRVLWPVRFADAGTEPPVAAHGGRPDPSFGQRIPSAGARRDELLSYDPQSVAPLAHGGRNRRSEAAASPQQDVWDEEIGALTALASPASPRISHGRRTTA